MAKIMDINFEHTGKNEGCLCSRCGQYITNIWRVKFSSGEEFKFGIDCYEKLMRTGKLTTFGMKTMKSVMKSIKNSQESLEKWIDMKEDECDAWKYEKMTANRYSSFEEFKAEYIIFLNNQLQRHKEELKKFRNADFNI